MAEHSADEPATPASAMPSPLPGADPGLFRWFFFGVFAFLLYQLGLILSLFSDAIIWAGSLALVFFPLHKFVRARLRRGESVTAGVSTIAVLLLVLVPLLFIGWIVIKQSALLYPTVRGWVNQFRATEGISLESYLPQFLVEYWQRFNSLIESNELLSRFDLNAYLLDYADVASANIAEFGAAAATNILIGSVNLLLILLLMFFCFRDGEKFLQWVLDVVPMPAQHTKAIGMRIYDTVSAVIRGALATASVQGVLAMIGYLIADVPLAIFFGVLTGFAAMVPVVGAGLIWAPIGIFVFTQHHGWGIFVLLWGFFLVSLVDNFLKPILIGTGARMPILLIFCGIIGGVNVYGFTGLMIGPILIACLLAFITIYRDYYYSPSQQVATGE
ncbi:MAG: AI-2E family transporter [Gammaproteobacteria bacterium]|nr:AI-2E family transporter [Gammaproteobacteria bacterium]